MAQNNITLTVQVKEIDGGLKELVCSGDSLRKIMESTVIQADRLKESVINLASLSKVIDSVNSTLTGFSSAINDLSAAYAVQEQAETQLATAMLNTMGATEEEIQSIKNLCSAQQELGVIGDEVQLQGAQRLASFTKEKRSMEALIPVMNDILAQQYGLNATGENAATVAVTLGKALNGQTTTLRRQGFVFSEAQEQILKFGTEEQRVAVLTEVVSAKVGGMNAELAKTDSGRMKQLDNTLGDIREQIGKVAQKMQKWITVGVKITTVAASMIKVYEAAKTAVTYVKALSISLRGLLISSGIGIALLALSAAVAYFTSKTDEATDSLNKFITAEARAKRAAEAAEQEQRTGANAYQNASASISLYIARIKAFNGTKAEEKKLVTELNNTYGSSMGYFKSLEECYEALTRNSKIYCRQMEIEATTRLLADKIAERSLKMKDIKEAGDRGEFSSERKLSPWHWLTGDKRRDKSEMEEAQDTINELYEQNQADRAKLQSLLQEQAKLRLEVIGSPTAPDLNTDKPDKKNTAVWTELPQSIKQCRDNIALLNAELENCTNPKRQAEINRLKQAFQEQADAISKVGLEVGKTDKTYIIGAKTVREYDQNISLLSENLKDLSYPAAIIATKTLIKVQEEGKKKLEDIGETTKNTSKIFHAHARTVKEAEENIAYLNEQLDNVALGDTEAASRINAQIKHYRDLVDTMRSTAKENRSTGAVLKEGYTNIKNIASGVEGLTQALKGNGNAWEKITGIVDGFISIAEGIATVVKVIDLLTEATKIHTQAKLTETVATSANTGAIVTETIATEAQTVADASGAVASATKSGAKLPFPANIVAIAAGVAAVMGVLVSCGVFASGGIVGGNSFRGDKLVARVNSGEMILNASQQSRLFDLANGVAVPVPNVSSSPVITPEVKISADYLRQLAAPAMPPGKVEFKIKRGELVGILNYANNFNSRT